VNRPVARNTSPAGLPRGIQMPGRRETVTRATREFYKLTCNIRSGKLTC
jgi:hypothetical protein